MQHRRCPSRDTPAGSDRFHPCKPCSRRQRGSALCQQDLAEQSLDGRFVHTDGTTRRHCAYTPVLSAVPCGCVQGTTSFCYRTQHFISRVYRSMADYVLRRGSSELRLAMDGCIFEALEILIRNAMVNPMPMCSANRMRFPALQALITGP